MATWINMRNRILCGGDSITVGYDALSGGWRKNLSASVIADGKSCSWAGPYSDSIGSHRGLAGDQAGAVTSAFQTECLRRAPTIIILAWGVNDTGTQTASTVLARMSGIMDWAVSGSPNAHIYQQTVLTVPTQTAKIAEINAALPSLCAARGITLIDMGNPARDAGNVHPIDGATGYDLMASTIYTAISSSLV
jgi:lysophospholipase L1-like esterase